MNIKKPLLVLGAVTGVGLAGITGLGVASAAAANDSNGQDTIIDKIATRFNLKKEDVAAVFDEQRAAHEAERKQHAEDRLARLVSEGKITEEQKSKILAKLEELRANRENNRETIRNLSRAEVRQLKENKREELKQWAQDNGIPFEVFESMFRHGKHMPLDKTDAGRAEELREQ